MPVTALGQKAPRPVGLKIKLGKLLISSEAVSAGVSVKGESPSMMVTLNERQHEPHEMLMNILKKAGGEMDASILCSKLYEQSEFARDHIREEYGSFKAFLTTSDLKDVIDFVPDQGSGQVVLNMREGVEADGEGSGTVVRRCIPEKYKTVMCRNYTNIGNCLWGDQCLFAHSQDELRHGKAA